MKAALYARVSTTDRDQNPETQLVKLRQVAQARGYTLTREYVDQASGADHNRPALVDMMNAAKQGDINAILIVRLDRMTRSLTNLLHIIEELNAYNVTLICTDHPIETNTTTGRLMTHILGALAEWERELIRERVKDGMENARAKGVHLGRPPRDDKEQIKREIIAILSESPDITRAEIARRLDISRGTLYRYLEEVHNRPKGGPPDG